MYDVMEVCEYIDAHAREMGYEIAEGKMEKLLYFVQGWFIILRGKPCFDAEIRAADYGPTIPAIHVREKDRHDTDISLTEEDKEEIDKVVDYFRCFSEGDLIVLATRQRPWRAAYTRQRNGVITEQDMREWFARDFL